MCRQRTTHSLPGMRWIGRSILFLTLILAAACSHTRAFYGKEVPEDEKQQAKYGGENEPEYLSTVKYRVILIGDAGQPADPAKNEFVLESAREWARAMPAATTVVFLGDNIYEDGMTGPTTEEKRRLDSQIDIVNATGPKGLFIPGNHDWKGGKSALKAQDDHIVGKLSAGSFYPKNGDPGPVAVDLPAANPSVRLIALDTQWWLRSPGPDANEVSILRQQLKDQLHTDAPVIVVAHHPLQTRGSHGGFYDLRDHLFPLTRWKPDGGWWTWIPSPLILGLPGGIVGLLVGEPVVVGAAFAVAGFKAYPVGRRYLAKNPQDLFSEEYGRMRKNLEKAFSESNNSGNPQPLLFAAGHEHSLQVFDGGSQVKYQVVSGAGSKAKLTPVSHNSQTLFAHRQTGFMVVDFKTNNDIWLRVIEPEEEQGVQKNVGKEKARFVKKLVGHD